MFKIGLILFSLLHCALCLNTLDFTELRTKIPCTNAFTTTASAIPMKCSTEQNIFSRLGIALTMDNERTSRLEKTFYIKTLPSGIDGIYSTSSSFEGCVSTTGPMVPSVGCSKLTLPLKTASGHGLSMNMDSTSKSLQSIYDVTAAELANVIQALEITISVGWLRYVYELSPSTTFAFPFEYDLVINTTHAAYAETQAAIANTPAGYPLSVVRCQPNFFPEADRLPGVLGGCYRAPCNCSNATTAGVPPYYTYEVHYVGPLGQLRQIVKNARGRLTTDIAITINAVAFLDGVIIDRRQLLQKLIPDVTAVKQLYSSIDLSLGSEDVSADLQQYPGALTGIASVLNVATQLLETRMNGRSVPLTQIAPDLTGGYVVDFLSDEEMAASVYRTNVNNPYSITGIPPPSVVSPDKFFFVSAAAIQKGIVFSSFLRNSCGYLGTSSLAALLDGQTLLQRCCDGTLIHGACLPGYNASQPTPTGFPSPAQILSNYSLYVSEFTPPGWQNYDYYLLGRTQLNFQPPMANVTGASPIIFMPVEANFKINLDISDVLMRILPTLATYKSLIPPLDVRQFPGQQAQPNHGCFFDSKTATRETTFYIQQICNTDSAGTIANVSIVFVNCQGVTFSNKVVFFTEIQPMSCTHAPFTLATFQPTPTTPRCEKMIVSSTRGSTAEVVFNNVICQDIPGIYTNILQTAEVTIEQYYQSYMCTHCDSFNVTCLSMCNTFSFPYLFTIVIGCVIVLFFIEIALVFSIKRPVFSDEFETSSLVK